MTLIYVLLAILMLAILIIVHELGHFFAARLMHIEVTEFSVGFGPRIFGWKSRKYDTKFSVRCIPLGGFCAFYGEDDAKGETKDDPRAFARQNVWKRMFTVLMGPLMNFVLAFVVATMFYWIGGVETVTGVDPFISEVMAAGPAYSAGLKAGDVITEINGENMLDGTADTLTKTIAAWKTGDAPMRMKISRGDKEIDAELTPVWDEEEQKMRIGVMVSGTYQTETRRVGFFEAAGDSAALCWNASGAILGALKDLVTTGKGFEEAAGPVGIVSVVSTEVASRGFSAYIELLVLISINLGLMNLLPIPGLDGSRLIFGLIEVIRGKPVPPQKEAIVHLIGMVFLFSLMIFFTFRDIIGLFR